jgi:hypothetical protein
MYLLAAILWCFPVEAAEPEPLSCVVEHCTVDYECAQKYGRWSCHCCESTPGKQQAQVESCNADHPPACR